ncbi:hypothetical protein DFP73DRAFT_560732 [Morchella snyderi]|nr:hypothetical protein DFP73DRAFT_560732 [Morchella snyderi]
MQLQPSCLCLCLCLYSTMSIPIYAVRESSESSPLKAGARIWSWLHVPTQLGSMSVLSTTVAIARLVSDASRRGTLYCWGPRVLRCWC